MKGRESGMPEEAYWTSFFNVDKALEKLLGAERISGDLVEFGCGYGTFTLPTAKRTNGIVTALDIEPQMVATVQEKAAGQSVPNIHAEVRDFAVSGTELADASQAHVMIYNLLHLEAPIALLREACRVLQPGGHLSVIHWRSDIPTPRGPSLAIRPTPKQCAAWIEAAGFCDVEPVDLQDCCPYHFGLIAIKPTRASETP